MLPPISHIAPAPTCGDTAQNAAGRSVVHLIKKILPFCLLLVLHLGSQAQKPVDYSVHANILFHFTKYINWPPHKKAGDFVIGVLGESDILGALQNNISNKKVGDQRIVIRKLSSSAAAASCHIVFLAEEESFQIGKLAEQTAGTHTLIVSESGGLARKGSCINFVIANDRLKLEISRKNIDKRNLAIATELLQLGKTVD